MSRLGKCWGGKAAEDGRLPSRVPADMADEIQRNTLLTVKEIQGLYDRMDLDMLGLAITTNLFRKFAPNGRLLFSRFCDTLGVLGMLDDTMIAERMFRAFDQNKDRELSFTEFATALGIMMRGTDDQKLDLSFRILNPTYTGTGKCLEDYRLQSVSTSGSDEIIVTSPHRQASTVASGALPRLALSSPPTSEPAVAHGGDEDDCCEDAGTAGADAVVEQESQANCSKVKDNSSKETCKPVSDQGLASKQTLRVPRNTHWFERCRSVIYADSLGLDEFLDLVKCLQASRRALLGGDGNLASDEEIAMTFLPLASEMPDGSRRMMLKDFKKAVHTSPRFLCLLGVTNNNMPTPSCQSAFEGDESSIEEKDWFPLLGVCCFNDYAEASVTTKSEKRNSLFSLDCTGVSCTIGGTVGSPLGSQEAGAAVRAELLRRVRQAEAQAEVQQRKLQQQQRDQLKQLAESLRAVERDVEAVKTALAAKAPEASPKPLGIYPREDDSSASQHHEGLYGRLCSSPVRSEDPKLGSFREGGGTGDSTANESPRKPQAQGGESVVAGPQSVTETGEGTEQAATAATAAAAAAFAALQQAEQQLNRILEESSLATCLPMHIADQLMVEMSSKDNFDAVPQDFIRGGASAIQRDMPSRTRRSILLPKLTGESGSRPSSEGISESATNWTSTQLLEGPRRHKVSFMVGAHDSSPVPDIASCAQENATAQSKATTPSELATSGIESRRRIPPCGRRMYMNRAKVYQRRTTQWRRTSLDPVNRQQDNTGGPSKAGGKDTKGFVVHFGHESWNMVINIMVGIRLAGARAMSEPHRAVEPYDFLMKEKFSVLPKTGMVDKKRRKPSLCAVRFIDYAPMVFRRLRAIFGIDSLGYIRSVGPEQLLGNLILGNLSSLSELVSEGKSGSLFYYTTDGRFMIKTVSKETAFFMRSVLFDYYKHVSTCSNTMLTRLCGLHALRLKDKSGKLLGRKQPWRRKTYFMVMENFFHTPVEIHRRYDLKGSTQGRSLPPELLSDPTVARKDNDMIRDKEMARDGFIEIGEERKQMLIEQIAIDAAFLRDHGIMDYSLLLGISYASCSEDSNICQDGILQIDDDVRALHSMAPSSVSSMVGIGECDLERPFWSRDLGGMQSTDRTKLYYVGIIDILTHWTAKKKIEHVARVLQWVLAFLCTVHFVLELLGIGVVVALKISACCKIAPRARQFGVLCAAGREAQQELPVSTLPFMPYVHAEDISSYPGTAGLI
ncbi:phosphatidylinositol-4-phosphate 5-kinase, putative [Eimeria praecox]|uniref:Phosphatidylinositol-4-phosphate 5-kinase, putative n=1 Tax=Eimeria praecox TaxID=51316 RepID=U6G7R5_9EIME|nr:phosphatidylinositol-4-phosphate 5-kinase, putative [Eimeria praecox]